MNRRWRWKNKIGWKLSSKDMVTGQNQDSRTLGWTTVDAVEFFISNYISLFWRGFIYQGLSPFTSKNLLVGPFLSNRAYLTMIAAPSAALLGPENPFNLVAYCHIRSDSDRKKLTVYPGVTVLIFASTKSWARATVYAFIAAFEVL